MRVLIVDDSAAMRRLLASLVSEVAGEITECADGAEAIRSYFALRPDWVVMDVRMHGLDGIAATREILRRDPAAKIVMVSQYDEVEIRSAASDAGAIAYVLKEDLLGIRKLLAGPAIRHG